MPFGWFSAAWLNSSVGVKPTFAPTNTASATPAVISSPALMICTHVVASMPPKIT